MNLFVFRICQSIATVTILIACGGGMATSSDLKASGALQKVDRSSDLAGPDLNGNGVRDDIDVLIAAKYMTPAERAAATQVAKSIQASLVVDLSDTTAVRAISTSMSSAINCVFNTFTGNNGSPAAASVSPAIESASLNTKARLLKYLAFAKALDGTSMASPEGDTCEKVK